MRSRPADLLGLLSEIVTVRRPALLETVRTMGSRPLSELERDAFCDLLMDEFASSGLLPSREPNERGLAIENLVDWIRGLAARGETPTD